MINREVAIAFDTETTGIGPEANRLTEIAAVEFFTDNGELTGRTYHTFLNPGMEIPPEVVAVHGKTWDDLKGEPLFKDIAQDFLDFVNGAHVTAHNLPFDRGFINAELKRAKIKGTPKLETVAAKLTDTLAVSRRNVMAKRHTLDIVCDRYGVDRSRRVLHGALLDCEMLAAVYPALMADAARNQLLLNSLLPFMIGTEIPEELDDIVQRHLHLGTLVKVLEAEQKRYTEAAKALVEGADSEGEEWVLSFSNRTLTDWDKIKKEHLPGDFQIEAYQTVTSAMSIKHK